MKSFGAVIGRKEIKSAAVDFSYGFPRVVLICRQIFLP